MQPFPDDIKEIVSLDPRLKEEYVKIFLELFKEEVEKNPSLSEVCLAQSQHREILSYRQSKTKRNVCFFC